MRFTVSCEACLGDSARISDYPDLAGAEGLVERHLALRGHRAVITSHLDTPPEGLLQ